MTHRTRPSWVGHQGDRRGAPPGERNGNAKLTADRAREIRFRYAQGSLTLQQLAEQYGVSHSTIHSIVLRRTWRDA